MVRNYSQEGLIPQITGQIMSHECKIYQEVRQILK
jgi:hypothetical protein